ncbi:ABC transporter ATP-binding protein [Spiroplasma clarkii]|uniref:ATP-binding cassette domain-containing protein n=1 Tax=Spiroplasma clarkii TaxID=2139 RepID=UPI0011BAA47E
MDDVSFEIKDGEAVAILGANGAGKSTLVEIIAGIIEPTSGEIAYVSEGKTSDSKKNDKDFLQKNVGIQFQSGAWPFNTMGTDLLEFFVGRKWKTNEYITELINVFEISSILKNRIASCSGGEQQRFNCFLSIINNPKILILDELITGLDLKMQIKLIKFFQELRKKSGLTLIVVSHIPEEVEQVCDRIIILKQGKIYKQMDITTVKKEFGSVRNLLTEFLRNKSNVKKSQCHRF